MKVKDEIKHYSHWKVMNTNKKVLLDSNELACVDALELKRIMNHDIHQIVKVKEDTIELWIQEEKEDEDE